MTPLERAAAHYALAVLRGRLMRDVDAVRIAEHVLLLVPRDARSADGWRLVQACSVAAGPWHPALRRVVRARLALYLRAMLRASRRDYVRGPVRPLWEQAACE